MYSIQGAWSPCRPWFRLFLTRYCFVCPILIGQVGVRQSGRSPWQHWWKQPNLSQQRIVYEVTAYHVQAAYNIAVIITSQPNHG